MLIDSKLDLAFDLASRCNYGRRNSGKRGEGNQRRSVQKNHNLIERVTIHYNIYNIRSV